MIEDYSKLWWENITGPATLIKSVEETIVSNKSVVLQMPSLIPWKEGFYSEINNRIHEFNREANLEVFDCKEESSDVVISEESLAKFLIDKYGYPETLQSYRKSSKVTIQEHMIKKEVLKNQIIWVTNITDEAFPVWYSFLQKFNSKGLKDGLFIIEIFQQEINLPNFGLLEYKKYITYYDQLLFNHILISECSLSPEWKQYIAMLATIICLNDIELSGLLINRKEIIKKSPVQCLKKIFSEQESKDKYSDISLDKNHPFNLITNNKSNYLKNKIWETQLKIIFPLLEEERINYIEKHKEELEYILGKHNITNREFGERITNPYDVEIGALDHISRSLLNNNTNLFSLKDSEEKNRLSLIHSMRNSIAHHEVCDTKVIKEFLDSYPYEWE